MTHYVEWRAYVGPMWTADTDATFWNWASALTLDATYAPESAIAPTTLASTLSDGATSAVLTDASTWPSAGSAFVGPNGSSQSWERISWTGKSTNTLTGVTRETVDSEQSGVHSAGAAVRFWWPLDKNDGTLNYVSQFDDRYVVRDWSLELAGVAFPQVALRNQSLVLVQWRWDTGAGLGSWQNAFVGWLDSPQGRDDAERIAEWRVRVNSSLGVLRYDEADGVRAGAVNLGENAGASASSTLAKAYKDLHTGDFTGEPSFVATNTTDNNSDSLWIGDRYLFDVNNTPSGDYVISQMHINPYVGQGKGYRWIEVKAGANEISLRLYAADGESIVIYENSAAPGGFIIFAENAALFEEENPEHQADMVVDVGAFNTTWFDNLNPAGGSLRLEWEGTSGKLDLVRWGTGTIPGGWESLWSGTAADAPGPGETMRYIYAPVSPSGTADYWVTSHVQSPGQVESAADIAWLYYELPRLTLQLHSAIDSGTTSVTIADPAGATGDGLPTSGTLQINTEQISYTGINRTTGALSGVTRGVNSTTAAAHGAGDKVYLVDGGVVTDGRLLKSITLTLPDDISAKLKNFVIRGSKQTTARTPNDEGYTADYSTLATVTNNTGATYALSLSPSQRLRFIVVEIQDMTVMPYRPRLAGITFAEDMTVYGANTIEDADTADVVTAIFDSAGLPSAAIVDAGDTPEIDNYTTANDGTAAVLSELCEFAGVRVTVGRDSKITMGLDPYWTSGSLPSATRTFDADDIAVYEKVDTNGRGVGQVELSWRNGVDTERGIERFPASRVTGRVARVGPIVRASAAAAQVAAQKRYWMMRRPYTVVAELQDAYVLSAGEIHQVAWDLDGSMLPISRLYMVVSADHQIRDNAMVTVAQYVQISRSDER